ncbi:formin-like protein 1 [Bubalus kerabau]|uniref:formin-like protein 1 n=1 Tax=Bubalus carabanensis TaxID=3119969 RepID=UPI00244EB6EC|nr:formin-like protein 1 [Bubalus carabanensis]
MGPGRRLPRPLRRAPGRARREGSAEEQTGADRRAGRSKLRLLRAPGPVQASNAAAAAASGFMAKTPAPLPLPPPPPPRTEVPVTRRSTPGLRGRSPTSAVRHVPPSPAPARVTWYKHVCPQQLRPSWRPRGEQSGAMLDPPTEASAPKQLLIKRSEEIEPGELRGGWGSPPSSSSTCTP